MFRRSEQEKDLKRKGKERFSNFLCTKKKPQIVRNLWPI